MADTITVAQKLMEERQKSVHPKDQWTTSDGKIFVDREKALEHDGALRKIADAKEALKDE